MLGQRNQVSKVEREVGSDPHTTYARSALRRVCVWYIYIYIHICSIHGAQKKMRTFYKGYR